MEEKQKELITLAEPITKWIRKNQTSHTTVVIDAYGVRVMSDNFQALLVNNPPMTAMEVIRQRAFSNPTTERNEEND